MGSWNESCALTHTQIKPGDNIVIITIRHNTYKLYGRFFMSNIISSYGNYPFGEIYCGKYDDYGGIEDVIYIDNLEEKYKTYIYIKTEAIEALFGKTIDELISEYNKLYEEYYYDRYSGYYNENGYIDFDRYDNDHKDELGSTNFSVEDFKNKWDKLRKEFDKEKNYETVFRKMENNFLMQIMGIFYDLRINPFYISGRQGDDTIVSKRQLKLHQIAIKMIRKDLKKR